MNSRYDVDNIELGLRPVICHWQSPEQQRILKIKREGNQLVDRDKEKLARLAKELKPLGVPDFFWTHAEARELATRIDESEIVKGVLYGYTKSSFAIFVATNRRILHIYRKHGEIITNRINYGSVKQVTWEVAGLFSLVTLQTKTKEYSVRTLNLWSADKFIDYVETRHAFGLAGRYSL